MLNNIISWSLVIQRSVGVFFFAFKGYSFVFSSKNNNNKQLFRNKIEYIYIYDFSKCCQYTPHMLYVFKNAIFTLFTCVRYFFQEQHALTIHTVKLSTWDVSCIINIMNAFFIQYMKRYTYFIGYHICTFFTPYLLSIYMYSRCYMIDL